MTQPTQLNLPLPQRVSLARDDYFIADSNRAAYEAVERWPDWPGRMLAVIGPAGAGKTHLAAVHAARLTDLGRAAGRWPDTAPPDLIVDDVDRVVGGREAEERLFHAFNRVAGEGGSLLLTSRLPVAAWPVALPDLRTRLNTVIAIDIPPPDDSLLEAVLLKLFADRQIDGSQIAEISHWLVPRMDRSLAAARALVEQLDARSLAVQRPITARLAREVLGPSEDL